MPRNESVQFVDKLRGVDRFRDATQIDDNQFRTLQNFYPPRGSVRVLSKRLGSTKFNASAISGVTRIDNGIRAWKHDGTQRIIIAGTRAGNDKLYVGDDALGTFAEITGGSVLPAAQTWSLYNWPLLGKCYIGGGTASTPIQITSDFATKSDMAIGAGATDAQYGQFLTVFHQRLIAARTPTNPNYVYYFDAASDSSIGASQFWRIDEPVTALAKCTFGTVANALREMLVVAGPHTLWYVAGDVSTAIEQASRVIGCKSPKTMVNTPIGLMFLGSDRNIYLIRTDPREPEKVGLAIVPELQVIPEAQLIDAAAVYHNGFYKLTFAEPGGATNTVQWWADLLPVLAGVTTIDWYGPMKNLALSAFLLLDGPSDALLLYGGDDAAGTVWKLDQAGVYQDGTAIVIGQITTKEFTEGDALRQKIWPGFSFGHLKQASGALSVTANINAGEQTQSDQFVWTLAGAIWDSALWDVDSWGGTAYTEDTLNWGSRIVGRSVQLTLVHNVNADFTIRDFSRKARLIRRMP